MIIFNVEVDDYFNVEVDDYFCTITGLSRQYRF